jgi:alkylation response protein AidB-like acyl-CoA dehydrogenase
MDFGLSQDQEMLCDAISRTLADTCPLDHVRECAEGSVPFSDNVRSALGEIGIWGMMVPEQHDGLGMTMLDAAVVAEQLGYAVAPVAFIGAHVLAPLALAQGGSEELKAHWLPRIAKGEAQIAVAIAETVEIRDRAGVDFDGAKLDGTALFALDFLEADAFLVADTAGRMHFVAGDAAGLEKVALKTIDRTRSVGELRFSGVAGEALADDGGATVRRLRDAGRVLLIGSFQAVKHMCAEMAARHEPCRSLVWYAAHAFDATPDEASLVACHAKSHTGEVHRFVARTSTEVHGGMGFTDLLGLHFWFKRIGFDRQVLGGPEAVRAEAAALQGWTQVA